MELVISTTIIDTATPGEVVFALRQAVAFAELSVIAAGIPVIDEQREVGEELFANVACATKVTFYRSE